MYSKAKIVDGADTHEIITFGPLCVEPKWQGCGVGELSLKETMKLAAKIKISRPMGLTKY
ncbi:hypothetical protein [Clostridium sp.]|uniref:hypothetical protein n=1 Tax=Clostridium sp. TaxID=1506 RepID=UPI0032167D3F